MGWDERNGMKKMGQKGIERDGMKANKKEEKGLKLGAVYDIYTFRF